MFMHFILYILETSLGINKYEENQYRFYVVTKGPNIPSSVFFRIRVLLENSYNLFLLKFKY